MTSKACSKHTTRHEAHAGHTIVTPSPSLRPDGKDIGQRGVYREIVRPEPFVHTESCEDWNPGDVLVTVVLAEQHGKTTLTNTARYPSQEVRDTLLKFGMMSGVTESYDKLAECLALLIPHLEPLEVRMVEDRRA